MRNCPCTYLLSLRFVFQIKLVPVQVPTITCRLIVPCLLKKNTNVTGFI